MTFNSLAPPDLSAIQPGDLVNEKEAAAVLGVAEATMRNWRSLKEGPRAYKIGKRSVRYLRSDLAAFVAGEGANS